MIDLLLQTNISIDGLIHIGELLTLGGTLFGAYYKLKNQIALTDNNLKNTNVNLEKLEEKTAGDYRHIEEKIQKIDEKIEQLPVSITNLIKAFFDKT